MLKGETVKKCYQIHPADNVAVLQQDAATESIDVIGGTRSTIMVRQSIGLGHKIAVANVAEGTPIVKFGVPIGIATAPINAGDWVHLHNCRSQLDQRSGTLDVDTGAAGDTVYE
jgi:hypothetical protein